MLRQTFSRVLGLFLLAAPVLAFDKELTGKITKVDLAEKAVTVDAEAEGKKEWKIGEDTRIVHTNGKEAKDGINVAWLVAGTEVKLTVPDRGKTIKEIRCVKAAAKADDAKAKDAADEAEKTGKGAIAKGKEKAKADAEGGAESGRAKAKNAADEAEKTGKGAIAKGKEKAKADAEDAKSASDKKVAKAKDSAQSEAGKFEARGTKAKVVSVDVDAGTAQVETEDGKKTTLKIGEDVAFFGPRGGISTKRIKDDRFVPGAEIRFYLEGKELKEVHLPYRSRKDGGDDEDEKDTPKKDKEGSRGGDRGK